MQPHVKQFHSVIIATQHFKDVHDPLSHFRWNLGVASCKWAMELMGTSFERA